MPKNGNGVFVIDGVDLRLWVSELTRSFAVTDSENSGRLQNHKMHRDIIGTFYNYTLKIDPDKSSRTDYDVFYEIITAPVESHKLIFPYGQSMLEFEAYVTSGSDNLKIGDENEWSGLSINFTAIEPQRR